MKRNNETCIGTEMALHEKIAKAIPKAFLAGIWNKNTGVSHFSIHEILKFVKSQGVSPTATDIRALDYDMKQPWTIDEAPATYFQRQDALEEQLLECGINKNHVLRLERMKAALQHTGEYKLEFSEWDRKSNKSFAAF
ncbi:hypothetical protein ACHAW6_014205 [Cyclotella cf. meneghiniana]